MSRTAFRKAIFLGDSLTQFGWSSEGGWLSQIADRYQRRVDIVNRGFSGYNARWCKLILPQLYPPGSSDLTNCCLFTIFLGTNDSNRLQLNPLQHVPPTEYHDSLLEMTNYLITNGVSPDRILLITLPPVDEVKWKQTCVIKGTKCAKFLEDCPQYARAAIEVGEVNKIQCLDLYEAIIAEKNWSYLFNDGLHFSAEGSNFLARLLFPILDHCFANISTKFPIWTEINYKYPEKSLVDI